MKPKRWATRRERARLREAIAEAGDASGWIRRGKERPAITDAERARHAAANAVADRFGFPRPYPDLDAYPRQEDHVMRGYLTAREYEALLKRQRGKCCVRGCDATEGLIAEHSTPNALTPGKPDQLMCQACHKVKTLRDVKAIAKIKRLSGKTISQYQRRKKFGPKLRGRGFDKRE